MGLALAVSVFLHAAALAALALWPDRAALDEPGEGDGVALIFADTAELAGGAPEPSAPPPPPAPPPAPQAVPEPPSPAMAAAAAPVVPDVPPAPPPAPPAVDAPAAPVPPPAPEAVALPPPVQPPAPEAASDPAAPAAPPDPAPAPPTTPMREAPRPVQAAARSTPPPQPAPRAAPGPVRLDAGAGALPDPSLGARALGAVVPPGADAAHRNAPPAYPPESRRRGEEGVVRIALRIAPDGQVEAAEVSESSGHPALDRAALEAARRWRFRPATQGGLPVAATLRTAVHFRLTDR